MRYNRPMTMNYLRGAAETDPFLMVLMQYRRITAMSPQPQAK